MKFTFSLKTTSICLLLALGMLRLSYWQWTRHLEKKAYIEILDKRLAKEPLPFEELFNIADWDNAIHRRIEVKGAYDFDNEIIIKNRRHDEMPGVHIVTPLLLENSKQAVLVNRGFIPFSEKDKREKFKRPDSTHFTALVKASMRAKLFAPKDISGSVEHKVSSWLRINIPEIQKQIPYSLLPVYLEIMPDNNLAQAKDEIVKASKGGKNEILNLALAGVPHAPDANHDWTRYPIPSFTTVIPAGRHFGYVFEWGIMAFITLSIGALLQLRRK